MDKPKAPTTLRMIRKDCEDDTREMYGAPFNGKTMGEYFGRVYAAVDALAAIQIQQLLTEQEENDDRT